MRGGKEKYIVRIQMCNRRLEHAMGYAGGSCHCAPACHARCRCSKKQEYFSRDAVLQRRLNECIVRHRMCNHTRQLSFSSGHDTASRVPLKLRSPLTLTHAERIFESTAEKSLDGEKKQEGEGGFAAGAPPGRLGMQRRGVC